MTKEELAKRVDQIIELAGDPERAHVEEDKLYCELLVQYLPAELLPELIRLQKADFPRWCA